MIFFFKRIFFCVSVLVLFIKIFFILVRVFKNNVFLNMIKGFLNIFIINVMGVVKVNV